MRRKLIAAALSALALSAVSVAVTRDASAGPSDPVTIGAPAYFSDATSWTRLLATPGLSHIVVNAYDAGTVSAINGYISQANGQGIVTLGYTGAGFAPAGSPNSGAAKSLATVQSDVGTIFAAYPNLGGIFLDEIQNTVPCDSSWVLFYADFSTWYRSTYPSKKLAFNPGAPLCSSFAGLADIYVMAERSAAAYNSALSYYNDAQFDWIRGLPNSAVWAINYATPSGSAVDQINSMSTVLGAGVIWTTPGATTNDYAALPDADYLCVLALRAAGTSPCGGATTSTTSTTTSTTSTTTTTTSTISTTSTTTTTITAAVASPSVGAAAVSASTSTAVATTAPAATTTAAPTSTTLKAPDPVLLTTTTTTTLPTAPTAAVAGATEAAPAQVDTPSFTG